MASDVDIDLYSPAQLNILEGIFKHDTKPNGVLRNKGPWEVYWCVRLVTIVVFLILTMVITFLALERAGTSQFPNQIHRSSLIF